ILREPCEGFEVIGQRHGGQLPSGLGIENHYAIVPLNRQPLCVRGEVTGAGAVHLVFLERPLGELLSRCRIPGPQHIVAAEADEGLVGREREGTDVGVAKTRCAETQDRPVRERVAEPVNDPWWHGDALDLIGYLWVRSRWIAAADRGDAAGHENEDRGGR